MTKHKGEVGSKKKTVRRAREVYRMELLRTHVPGIQGIVVEEGERNIGKS